MSYAPASLEEARDYIQAETGLSDAALGIVGDKAHKTGYHLGRDRLKSGDYSARLARDKRGLSNAAMALDIGNFKQLQQLTAFIVAEARAGRAPDIREVIGPKGSRAYRWDFHDDETELRSDGDSHEWHLHISYYRDSEHRDKTAIFKKFFGTETPEKPSEKPPAKPQENHNWIEEMIMALPETKQGAKGAAVRRIQALIVAYGGTPKQKINAAGGIDGLWGAGTTAAVKAFQKAVGLTADGIVGPKTWRKLVGV
jgi:hypothetical protein